MALGLSAKRATAIWKAGVLSTKVNGQAFRQSSQATAAASNLAERVQREIYRDAKLPNPDPAADSQTATLINEHAPYMVSTYARPPLMLVKGQGCYVWDVENRKYLDFTAGIAVNALGHCPPEVSKMLAEQAGTLVHCSNLYYNPWIGALSKLLVEKTLESGGMHDAEAAFICNSGSEANEAAIKFARKVGKVVDPSGEKTEIVSFTDAFHGRTLGALSATHKVKYQKPFSPMVPGFREGRFNDLSKLENLVTEKTCGVMLEPIQGEGGIIVADDVFLTAIAKRCRDVGAVLIYDEIQCGLSRTGKLWAHSHLPKEAHPDILTTAKALGNGFPIGATVVNNKVAQNIKIGDHGTTFGGNPLGSRLAHHIVSRLSESKMQKDILTKSTIFQSLFADLQEKYPHLIEHVRGKGLMLALQLSQDPAPIVTAARERGLLIITAGTNTLRFVPPLIISEAEIEEGMKILDEAMRIVTTFGEGPAGVQVNGEVDSPN